MEPTIILTILFLAFVCEFVDSSLGMGYGTLLAPLLLILGFELDRVIIAVLLSQGASSLTASFYHQRYGNMDLRRGTEDFRLFSRTVGPAVVIIVVTVLLQFQLPHLELEVYIALVAIVMGIIVLSQRRFSWSSTRFAGVTVFAVFNKALTGTGFGPTFTTGQIISGRAVRSSVGLTTALEAAICLSAFGAYVALNGPICAILCAHLTIGAVLATPFGPLSTREHAGDAGRLAIGVLVVFLGVFLLVKNFVWEAVTSIMTDPFFWALLSLFALVGAMATIASPRLGLFPRFNILWVFLFSAGRFILPLDFVEQPRFDLGGWEWVLGVPLLVAGLGFMMAILQIRPWPAPGERVLLATTGLYGLVRHPCYLGEVLWGLGLSLVLGSTIGVALTPVWWGGLLFHSVLEEEEMERRVGEEYERYRRRVRGRIIPGLPI